MSRIPRITDGKGNYLALPAPSTKTVPGISTIFTLPPAMEKIKGLPWYETQQKQQQSATKALPASNTILALPAPPSSKKTKKGKAQEPVLVIAPTFQKVKFSNDDGQYSRERPVPAVREFGLFEDFVGSGRPDPFFL